MKDRNGAADFSVALFSLRPQSGSADPVPGPGTTPRPLSCPPCHARVPETSSGLLQTLSESSLPRKALGAPTVELTRISAAMAKKPLAAKLVSMKQIPPAIIAAANMKLTS